MEGRHWTNIGKKSLESENNKGTDISQYVNKVQVKEVFSELKNNTMPYKWGRFKEKAKKAAQYSLEALVLSARCSAFAHIIPTTIRYFNDHTVEDPAESSIQGVRGIVIMTVNTGIASNAYLAQIWGYMYLSRRVSPWWLMTPVVTNIISGAYEIYRKAKNDVIEKKSIIKDTYKNAL